MLEAGLETGRYGCVRGLPRVDRCGRWRWTQAHSPSVSSLGYVVVLMASSVRRHVTSALCKTPSQVAYAVRAVYRPQLHRLDADSTPLVVCHTARIRQHRVFADLAARSKNSVGWFFDFQLHLVVNDRGDLLANCLTLGNFDDRRK
jgi:Transposase DDE domain